MLRFSVLVFVAVCGLSAALDASLNPHWVAYKAKHGKAYNGLEEHQRRSIFEKSVKKINGHNLRYDLGLTSFRLGLNRFADVTAEEFKAFRGLRFNATAATRHGNQVNHVAALPASVDWRKEGYVTPVKDQGQCGSCWAFSTTGSLEGQNFKKTGKLVSLSEQNLVDCSGSYGNEGCNGGLMDSAFAYIKANGGLDTEASYPYTATDGSCKFAQNSVGATCTGYVDIKQGDESDLQKAVATVGPVSVAIDASNFSFQLYSGGVYDESSCSSTMLDHGVLAVGYGTESGADFWLVKNSWGASWGEEGYIKMSRNKDNQCGIASSASYPTV